MSALSKIYDMGAVERRKMGMAGHDHVEKNYNFKTFNNTWINFMDKIYEEEGSWENRKDHSGIRFMEVA